MTMDRRSFLRSSLSAAGLGALGIGGTAGTLAATAADSRYRNLLVLIELKGGNDGLNTVAPYADPAYYALRPRLALARDSVVQVSDRAGLHPSLAPLLPIWQDRQLAVLQGVGYPAPNLSHFRSIEIWDTASSSEEYLAEGWLTRAFAEATVPRRFAADGVIVGGNDLGPLAGAATRAVAITNTDAFLRQARLAAPSGQARNKAYRHILRVEADIVNAAAHLDARRDFATEFPDGGFGNAVRTACQVIANPAGTAVVRLSLSGFDTHGGQAATHARILSELARGIVALKSALDELDRWHETLILTYAEFGRRPRENLSGGTDHGTAGVHFALGGRVAGGFYGEAPALQRLNGDGNLGHTTDFRQVYATVLERWWSMPSESTLGGRFAPVPFLRT
jgi:uncharacterized protein (DUF1501 family)